MKNLCGACTHCGAPLEYDDKRGLCKTCRSLSFEERMEKFPKIRELSQRICLGQFPFSDDWRRQT